jgi:hypothetical protein
VNGVQFQTMICFFPSPTCCLMRGATHTSRRPGSAWVSIRLCTVVHLITLCAKFLVLSQRKDKRFFASFSAAQWLAPYARAGAQYFYADGAGVRRLEAALTLSSPSRGENIIVTIPKDKGLFRSAVEPAPGVVCTDSVQTYLDLVVADERGREAAEHLRHELLNWSK